MTKKKEISKGGYVSLVWICICVGLMMNAAFSTHGIMNGFDYYTAVYMGIGLLLTGFGVGLAVAHSFKIK